MLGVIIGVSSGHLLCVSAWRAALPTLTQGPKRVVDIGFQTRACRTSDFFVAASFGDCP